ncbi:MAG: hypothetical protein RMA76_37960 [Deltaproteobacteria bacterium]|jgi:hypothetical protein
MDQNNSIRSGSVRLSTVATTTRQTPKTDFGSVMRNGLIRTGQVVTEGLRVAAPFIPGGAIVSAALAGANSAAGMAGPSYARSGGGGGGAYGSSVSGLASVGGNGPGVSSGGAGTSSGVLGLPGQSPGLSTNLSASPSNFAGAASTQAVAGAGAGSTDAFNQMMSATRQMSEFQASFNLQYLQLQQKIQIDTRQFNLISNIMKTKHDAAKNALNNVR